MALHGHTCGIGAAVPGMLHWSGRFTPKRERTRGQGTKEEIPDAWEGGSGKKLALNIYIYTHF